MNARASHKWWSTLTSAMYGFSSLLPPLTGGGGGLVCESIGESDHFYEQSIESLLICRGSPINRLQVLSPLLSG